MDHKAESGRDARFRFIVDGQRNLEDVPLRELAALLDGFAGLVARGSAAILNRPLHRGPGRQEREVEDAARIRLVSLTSGSIVADLLPAPPKPQPDGNLSLDVESLSEQALGLIVNVAAGEIGGHPDLAKALLEFTERHVGHEGGGTLTLEDMRPDHKRSVRLDLATRDQLSQRIAETHEIAAPKDVTGRLFEANLEARSGQVRTPTGEKVSIEYDPEQEAAIKDLLGERAALRGEIIYDSKSHRAKAVRITHIDVGEQLGLDFDDVSFWIDRPVGELVADVGARPVVDAAQLEMHGIADEDWTALYEALGLGR